MAFTTQIFLFVFFPLCMLAYILADRLQQCRHIGKFFARIRSRDLVVLVFSLGFYAWAFFGDVLRLLVYVGAVYFLARWIASAKKKYGWITLETAGAEGQLKRFHLSILPFCAAVAVVVFCLVYYHYAGKLAQVWNWLFKDHLEEKSLLAPLGFSFITFSAVSYLTDIYRGHAAAGSLLDCACYLTFFPKVISGPIVLWKDFQPQMKARALSWNQSVQGLNRIMIGFAKKIILADTFGACVSQIGTNGIDQITAAGAMVLYMLQIYYDFSGYSDIAIGLSLLFGFEVKENFRFPYRSKSISEFWRRWHISLGAWFREYVYIPLGGSRAGYGKTLRNLMIVFVLTGLWHGTGWNYLLWGILNGAIVVAERAMQDKPFYKKIPAWVKYGVTMLAVLFLWQIFRLPSLSDAARVFGILLGAVRFDAIAYTWQFFFDAQLLMFAAVGIAGATFLGSPKLTPLYQKCVSTKTGFFLQELFLLALFLVSILFMVNSAYRPFLYFQY